MKILFGLLSQQELNEAKYFWYYLLKNPTFFLDDYMTARTKAKKAEETSDLNTESDTEPKRRRIIKTFSSSDEDDFSNNILPLPPSIKKTTKILGM